MKIAVLGTGNVGGVLGCRWAARGHEVIFGSRDPEHSRVVDLLVSAGCGTQAMSSREAVAVSEIVVLATPWKIAREVLAGVGDLRGKVLIDCINPINEDFTGLSLGYSTSAAEQIASWAPGARVVKAFNTVSAATMADPKFGDERATLFYCGDDPEAKQWVRQLAEDLEFDPVDAGPLTMARYLEPLAMLYIQIAIRQGYGANCAFKIITRNRPKPA